MRILRVFPRRTSMIPTDDLAFVGEPPLIRPDADEVHVSVTFSWDVPEGHRLAKAWSQYYRDVLLGGPAFRDYGDFFMSGFYVRRGVTFTSRGCNHQCPWCLVPEREGKIRHLTIREGHTIQDNNLLQTGHQHMDKVFAMLKAQRRAATFSGGLEAGLVDDWVSEELRAIRIKEVFLACDTEGGLKPLRKAVKKLSFLPRRKLRCYVLIGFGGETLQKAEDRLEAVWEAGCLPFTQLYQPPEKYIGYPPEWTALARKWSRPAAMFATHGEG